MIEFEIFETYYKKTYFINSHDNDLYRIYPSLIKWKYNNVFNIIEDTIPMRYVFLEKKNVMVIFDENSSKFPSPNNLVVFNLDGSIKSKNAPPYFKSKELIGKMPRQSHFASFGSIYHSDEVEGNEYQRTIILDDVKHILISLNDGVEGDFHNRAGEKHELQALNVETGKFHPTWCKYKGRF